MLRLTDTSAALTLTSRLARPRAVAVLLLGLVAVAALAAAGGLRAVAVASSAGAAAFALLGSRAVRARLEPAHDAVTVRFAVPFQRPASRRLHEFATVAVETLGEARAARADALARVYAARSGGREMPSWLRTPAAPGSQDHLRRLVLRGAGEPLPLTAWLADDDLEPARAAIARVLGAR